MFRRRSNTTTKTSRGKLIVATDEEQLEALARIQAQAAANGVDDLQWLDPDAVRALEPEVACVGALLSPSTGIIDSHALMLAYQGDAEDQGAMIAFHAPLTGGKAVEDGVELAVGGPDPMRLHARSVINAAGLHAPAVALGIEGLPASRVPRAYFAKGNYYTLSGARPFSHLVYPVPEKGGLGIHVTIDMAGQVRFGPDMEWIDAIDYDVDPGRSDGFYEAIRRYYPGLKDGAIEPGYAGIRPKIQPPGAPAADFMIQGVEQHAVAGLVNLFGIDSPGLTASMALAAEVVRVLTHETSRAA
ncbi:MAG: FAD-dependent oxidoreductase [Pseudomonadota bacterium]